MALEILTLVAALFATPAVSERETLDRLESEVFGAARADSACPPGDSACGEALPGVSFLDQPLFTGAAQTQTPGKAGSAALPALPSLRIEGFTFPVEMNESVRDYIRFFQGRGKHILAGWLSRMGRHKARLETLLAKEGAPAELVYVAMNESGFDPTAVSRASAVGPWQFVLKSGQAMGLRRDDFIDERRSWSRSTSAAARYLLDLERKFGSWPLALAAYNCGPGTVARAIEATGLRDYWTLSAAGALPLGTTRYVPKIMAAMIIGEDPARYGFADVRPAAPVETVTVHLSGGRDLRALARSLDLSADLLADLNPELRRGYTPPGATEWPIEIPTGALDRFHEHVDAKDLQGHVFEEHKVRFGERLRDVAAASGSTQTALRRLNELPEGEPRAGQVILAPAASRKGPAPEPPLLVRTDPGLSIEARGRREVFFPVPDKMEVAEIAAFFGVSMGDVGLWNGLDPQTPVRKGMVLRLFVATDFDLATALVVPADEVTVVAAGSAAAENALAHAGEARLPGVRRISHRVAKGDTLHKIAKRYGVSLQALRAENGLGPRDAPARGKVLEVPTTTRQTPKAAPMPAAKRPAGDKNARTYKVQPGDTILRIAKRLKVKPDALRKANGIDDDRAVRSGRLLKLP